MITRGGDRVGIYYNEKGASQRGSVCIYDRANSAIQLAQPSDFDWDKIFEGVDWFHFTGITPALGANVVEICLEACKAAKAHGVKISCDLNYRGKLWTRDQAREAMTKLCEYVDVCISNEEDAKDVFGIEAEATDIYGGKLNAEGYKSVAKQRAVDDIFRVGDGEVQPEEPDEVDHPVQLIPQVGPCAKKRSFHGDLLVFIIR
jgi:2-dehydro-3-deoxygluconokinase